jgi:hypothetical protein
MVPMNNDTTITKTLGNRSHLDAFFAFARDNQSKFATVERFRPCGRLITSDADSSVGYEVATFDMPAAMRAFVAARQTVAA